MNLGDLENYCLVALQQPGAINLPAAPNWAALTNPQFSQGVVDFYIARGYERLLGVVFDLDLGLVTASFPSQALTGLYPINPPASSTANTTISIPIPAGVSIATPLSMAGIALGTALFVENEIVTVTAVTATTFTANFVNAHVLAAVARGVKWPVNRQLRRAYYSPQGLNYTQEYRPGGDLISWDEFQNYTDQGFLTPTSYGTQPGKMAVTPDRSKLAMYTGSALAGDVITIQYAPTPTPGADVCPTLVLPTDTPITPPDTHEAIVQWALVNLWLRERQAGMANAARAMFNDEIARIRNQYANRSAGDSMSFEDKRDGAFGVLGSVSGLIGRP